MDKKPLKFQFSKVELKDLEGKNLGKVNKELANAIYQLSGDLGMLPIAQDIYNNKEVELTPPQIEELTKIVSFSRNGVGFAAFARKAILDYISSVTQ